MEAADGLDATVLLAEDGPLAARLRDAGASVEVMPLEESARDLKRAELRVGRAQAHAAVTLAGYVGRLRARLRELQPDLVHTYSLKSGLYGSIAARLARRPVIWNLQDQLSPDYLPRRAVRPMRAVVSTLPSGLVAPSRDDPRGGWAPRSAGAPYGCHPLPDPDAG